MIKDIENYTPNTYIEKFYNWVIIKKLLVRVKFGFSIDCPLDTSFNRSLTDKITFK